MADRSAIEWTEATWNPVTGCSKVSPGCAHCYAETFAERWRGVPGHPYEQGFDLQALARAPRAAAALEAAADDLRQLDERPLPRGASPTTFIARGLRGDGRADWHVFQVLTKRHERLAGARATPRLATERLDGRLDREPPLRPSRRLPARVPAAVRFISAEPLLGPLEGLDLSGIDWLIAGGESGPGPPAGARRVGARPPRPLSRRGRRVLLQAVGRRAIEDRRARARGPHLGRDAGTPARSRRDMTRPGRSWGYWTRAKLEMLADYLAAFATASKGQSERVYLDAFAGEGAGLDRLTGEEFPGSARIALEAGEGAGFTKFRYFEMGQRAA